MKNDSFVILIDSCGELSLPLRQQYDLDYCAMTVSVDGKEVVASLDYDQGITFHDFYEIMRNGTRIFTSAVPQNVFEEKFEHYLKEGKDVLFVGCSTALSATVNIATKVAERLRESYPERKIVIFDTKSSCYGQAFMAIHASKMRENGASIEEIHDYLKNNYLRYNQFATVDDLKYLKQAGRVKASAAFFGNLFKVHPIIISDVNGANTAVKKVKGKKAALLTLAEEAIASAEDVDHEPIFVGHCDDLNAAEFVKTAILSKLPNANVIVGPIGPIVGASTGPGTIGVFTFGKKTALDYVNADK